MTTPSPRGLPLQSISMHRFFSSRNIAFLIAAACLAGIAALVLSRSGSRGVATDGEARAPRASAATAPDTTGNPMRAALERGNVEYRAGRFEAALVEYRAAVAVAPTNAAPWIGVHMSATKLGRTALADSAQREIAKRVDTSAAGMATSPHPPVRTQ